LPTILITGASRGLGLELARQYAAEGWRVIGTVRDARGRAALGALSGHIEPQEVDVTDRSHIARLASELRGEPIDVLYCSAGLYGPQGMKLGRLEYAAWEDVLRVNLLGAAAVLEALVENVAASERKVMAVMSSRLGSIAEASGSSPLYATSKAALNALAKGLAVTLASRGIIVVALSPGWVRTDMGGKGAPLTPEASVSGLRAVIARLKTGDSGRFLNYDGSEIPW
jgi:NAD(P)-dependent dehydrogenase (short-subunit alcohol dehydrogenase family)